MVRFASFLICLLVLLRVLLPAGVAQAAVHDTDVVALSVDTGAGVKTYTARAVASLPAQAVTVGADPGSAMHYRCTRLQYVLQDAGVAMGKAMRGARLGDTVTATAGDGFTVAFALVELDAVFRPDPAYLCYEKEGELLDAAEGPLRLIVPDDLRKGRWVRQLKSLKVNLSTAP